MQELQLLQDKLGILLKKYNILKAENAKLKGVIAEQLNSIEKLDKKLTGIEEEMVALQMGKTVLQGNEKEDMRRQLDNVIGEIDKILNALNE